LQLAAESLESAHEADEGFCSLLWHPSWSLSLSVSAKHRPGEELPFTLAEQMREDTFDKMQAVGQSITLEQRSPYLREAKLDQTI